MTVSACPPCFEQLEQHGAEQRSQKSAHHQHCTHVEIDTAAPHMREHARYARAGHLCRSGSRGNCRRNAVKDEQGRGQEPAADAEHARQHTHGPAEQDDHNDVYRQPGYRQVDIHRAALNPFP